MFSSSSKLFASSDSPRVITVTTLGLACGVYSKHSFAQWCWSTHTMSTPASNCERKSTVTRAESWKSPTGWPTRRGASEGESLPGSAGSMNRSLPAGAQIVSVSPSTSHASGVGPSAVSSKGSGAERDIHRSTVRGSTAGVAVGQCGRMGG